jgi:hypothetical protein
MNKKTQIKILSFAVASSFFLPIFNWHNFEMNGLNFILSSHIDSYKYLLLLIPMPAFLLFTEMQNEHSLFFNSKILSCLPMIGLVLVSVLVYSNEKDSFSFYGGHNIFSLTDVGFWPLVIFSSLLMFTGFEYKAEKQYA